MLVRPRLFPLIDRRRPEGIFINPFERGEISPDLFRAACRMRKRRDRAYRGGRCAHWIKIKNRQHPAMDRVVDAFGESSANGAQSKTFPTLTAFRPQCLGSIDFPNWAGAVYALELQTF